MLSLILMIKSYAQILRLIQDRVIENVADLDQINAASLDVTLGPEILVEKGYTGNTWLVNYGKRDKLEMVKFNLNSLGYYDILPGQFMLCHTREVFNMPLNLAAEYRLKSSMGRIGLNHLTSGWCDPGWHGSVLTLEFVNVTQHHAIRLHAGDRIGQVVFQELSQPVKLEHSYTKRGRYNEDKTVVGMKL